MAALPPEQWKRGKVELLMTKTNPTIAMDLKAGHVTNVFPCFDLVGYIYNGDYIISVNSEKVLTTADLTASILKRVPGKLIIEFRRDEHCTFNLKPLQSTKAGVEIFEILLTWRSGGTPIGLLIHRDFQMRVVVAMVESGSTASKVIRPGDFLLKVNQKEVPDRDQARKVIMESINASKKVTLTLERQRFEPTAAASVMAPPSSVPDQHKNDDYTPTTYGLAPSAPVPTGPAKQPPVNRNLDGQLPADVLDIMAKNQNFFKMDPPHGSALKKLRSQPIGHLEATSDKPEEIVIPFDPSTKPLKLTPKRVGS